MSAHQITSDNAIATLLFLSKRARASVSMSEMQFLLVNESQSLLPYRQAAYWESGRGVQTVSGVTTIEKHAPYIQWLEKWFRAGKERKQAVSSVVSDLALLDSNDSSWREWLPQHVLTIDLQRSENYPGGRLLLAREVPFSKHEIAVLGEWCEAWRDQYLRRYKKSLLQRLGFGHKSRIKRNFIRVGLLAVVLAACAYPVKLSVLAKAELIPLEPSVVRAPMDGVVDQMLVQPNQRVAAGEPLFQFDQVALISRLEVAQRALVTAETEYRQRAQQALFDRESKSYLSILQSQIKERQIEVNYLQELYSRSTVVSPRAGLTIYDDPNEWIGRPVVTGERILLIADETQVQVEAWLSPSDMIDLSEGTEVRLFLTADPTNIVMARLTYLSYQPELRPDGLYAYRMRAQLTEDTAFPRVGLKGTARLEGESVRLIYWVVRRPWASLRGWLGV